MILTLIFFPQVSQKWGRVSFGSGKSENRKPVTIFSKKFRELFFEKILVNIFFYLLSINDKAFLVGGWSKIDRNRTYRKIILRRNFWQKSVHSLAKEVTTLSMRTCQRWLDLLEDFRWGFLFGLRFFFYCIEKNSEYFWFKINGLMVFIWSFHV